MLPAFLRSSRALPLLSVASVGLSLAAGTGFAFGLGFDNFETIALLTALPTLVLGTAWAALLRWRRTATRWNIRLGWLLSIPLAAFNAALVGGLMMGGGTGLPGVEGLLGVFLGATVGAIFWLPALVVTLAVFGAPIAWSQRQARRGLLGAERGEIAVGLVCALLSLGLLVALASRGHLALVPHLPPGASSPGEVALTALSALGLVTGAGVMGLAGWRGRLRRQLVEAAEAGERTDYRVEQTPAGRVLLRVQRVADEYRQADAEEELFALEEPAPPGASVRSGRGQGGTTG